MTHRELWLDDAFGRTRAGQAARATAATLDVAERDWLLERGDAFAEVSVAVAQRYFAHGSVLAPALGRDDVRRWTEGGIRLLAGDPPNREAALAYFAIAPRVVTRASVDVLLEWAAAAARLSDISRRLTVEFLTGTAALLGRRAEVSWEGWAAEGRALSQANGWRGELYARALFQASAAALPVLTPEEYSSFAHLAVSLAPAAREGEVFAALPDGLSRLGSEDRQLFFAAVHRAAASEPRAAWNLYRQWPAALGSVHHSVRSHLMRVLAAAAGPATEALQQVLPVAAALVRDIPSAERTRALARAAEVAEAFPRGSIALLRSLPLAFEQAPPAAIEHWITRGLDLARANADAGEAYFACESRTSLKVLHASSTAAALADVQGTLRKYIQMLSGLSCSIRATSALQLRPELEEFPLENEVALPMQIDRFANYEENARLYRFIAAQVAGRRLYGTYQAQRPDEAGKSLFEYLNEEDRPANLDELFRLTEGVRVAARLAREFPGLGRERRELADALLDRIALTSQGSQNSTLDIILLWLLAERGLDALPAWLRTVAAVIGPCVAPLTLPSASVDDSLEIAEQLAGELAGRGLGAVASEFDELAFERLAADSVYDMFVDDDGPPGPGGADASGNADPLEPSEDAVELPRKLELDAEESDASGGAAMSPEELQQLLESGVDLRIRQSSGGETDGLGLYISDLIGKVPREALDEIQRVLGDGTRTGKAAPRRWLERRSEGATFYYDEWDYHIQDYRQRWCRLLEVAVGSDSGEFFQQALADYAALIPDVRRQFQRIRPETYRIVRGLEHGEDFDLNAVVDARIDRRARRSPSDRLYVARQREERDVATLFLIDLSASTDEPFESSRVAPASGAGHKPRRIIDVTKEALVVMAEALEEIGDAYAIYGFSGHGRKNVEFYLVKSFNEALSGTVKGRIGALEPKRSTRMGAALRHAAEKMAAVSARSRHIILLSDGFPQDFDYGQDRRSNIYGLRDTTVALREAEANGIVPFCITVDKAGHDYLREMCDESRYLVIDDIASLPTELPKVYQKVVSV